MTTKRLIDSAKTFADSIEIERNKNLSNEHYINPFTEILENFKLYPQNIAQYIHPYRRDYTLIPSHIHHIERWCAKYSINKNLIFSF